jgi:hypothetical protein
VCDAQLAWRTQARVSRGGGGEAGSGGEVVFGDDVNEVCGVGDGAAPPQLAQHDADTVVARQVLFPARAEGAAPSHGNNTARASYGSVTLAATTTVSEHRRNNSNNSDDSDECTSTNSPQLPPGKHAPSTAAMSAMYSTINKW